MNDPPEVGRLPRFARDITRLPTGDQGAYSASNHCVLRPFSGVLDVSLGHGRVPTLDLSYLTLEPIVARAIARSTSSHDQSWTDSAGTPNREFMETGTESDRSVDGPDEGRPEPRVRDVVHDQRPAHREGAGHQAGTPDADGSTRTHLDLDSGQHPAHWRSTETPGEPTQDRDASGSVDRRAGIRPATSSEPMRTTLDRGPGETPSTAAPGEPDGPERWDTTPVDHPIEWSESAQPGSSPETLNRPADHPSPDRTVIERSGPTPEEGDTTEGRPTPPTGERLPSAPSGVEPPRMVARRQTAEPGQGDASTVGRRRRGSAAESVDAVTGPDRRGGARQEGSAGASTFGATGPSVGPSGPRMVVDRGEASADVDGSAGVGEVAGSAGDDGVTDATRGPSTRQVDRGGKLEPVIDASTDPESRLVDRLYRALQEREAIERRRRGGDV